MEEGGDESDDPRKIKETVSAIEELYFRPAARLQACASHAQIQWNNNQLDALEQFLEDTWSKLKRPISMRECYWMNIASTSSINILFDTMYQRIYELSYEHCFEPILSRALTGLEEAFPSLPGSDAVDVMDAANTDMKGILRKQQIICHAS